MGRSILNVDIEQYLKNLADITYIPFTHFSSDGNDCKIINSYPQIEYSYELTNALLSRKHYLNVSKEKVISMLNGDILYAYIKVPDSTFLLIGPIVEVPITNSSASQILKKLELPQSSFKQLIDYYDNTPHYSIYRFAKIVMFIAQLFRDEDLQITDILPDEYKNNRYTEKGNSPNQVSIDENAIIKSHTHERELYSYIYTGQYEKLKKFLDDRMYDSDIPIYIPSVMRNNKYLLVVSVTLSSRAADMAGVNYDTAMKLADFYIQKIDEAQSFEELFDIHKNMLLKYAKLVADSKSGKPDSALYYKVRNYCAEHLYEKITTSQIASAIGITRTFLSTQFKVETGTNISDFIISMKIDEAKRLLIATDRSLVEIANCLSFSSQSYFTQVFKDYVGCTPKEFKLSPIRILRKK